ncbi:MAG: hypothetical protein ACM3N5_07650 [Candidatus Eiseniibacteriota bacterium]
MTVTEYRCYCLHTNGRVHLATVINAESDDHAKELGADQFGDCLHNTVEIWDGIRCVGKVKKGPRAATGPFGAPADAPADADPARDTKD